MYKKIMVPVDLAHLEELEKSLLVSADLAKHYAATLHFVAITSAAPSEVARTPDEFSAKLRAFAAEQGTKHAIQTSAHATFSHDPTADLNSTLLDVAEQLDADLIVMASHIPNASDLLFVAHGAAIAADAGTSVLLVR